MKKGIVLIMFGSVALYTTTTFGMLAQRSRLLCNKHTRSIKKGNINTVSFHYDELILKAIEQNTQLKKEIFNLTQENFNLSQENRRLMLVCEQLRSQQQHSAEPTSHIQQMISFTCQDRRSSGE